MKNKQIEIILESIDEAHTYDYVVDTFYHPIKQLKNNIARGLKGMKNPIANEDLSAIKANFMRFEMEIDRNLEAEKEILSKLLSDKGLSEKEKQTLIDNLQKEKSLVAALHSIFEQSNASCQVYELLKQVLFKSEDRMDVLEHYMAD